MSITAGSQENHCLHSQVSEEASDGDSELWCVCVYGGVVEGKAK